mmetsp:Transcript_44015/g.71630  ORF Transcript_44015/g.71630 Transcript_44015/m.71630 type:complete len:468 (+) Transcript_44015:218-1621(+)|eukprot:CAMPEP_0184649952 /NCGR_PEP_ID=MMETSP0308-20130426/7420_1 /TAXON_ID=38269 /ORGANISM="Gloeochaete witrockiana, Strain SAG 46.84" /LENGTH=467 /DNA_ID=CAMNT_0027083109 /DNA_START=135 /DNA_END=1541 /DNA_ORIENTATION=+
MSERSPLLKKSTYANEDLPIGVSPRNGKRYRLGEAFSRVCNKQVLKLLFFLLLTMVVAAGNRIQYKKMLNQYRFKSHDYAYFLNQFTVVLYCILAWFVVFYRTHVSKQITPEMKAFPMIKFAIMGLFDALSSYLGTIGGVYTAGQLQTLLDQSVIPLTMVSSLLFLSARYNRWQYTGALMIIAGVGLATVPTFQGHSEHNDDGFSQTRPMSILIYSLSSVPSALSNVYKEWAFKAQSMDIYYLTLWVSSIQFVWGFVFAPLQAIPGISGPVAMPLSDIPSNLKNGFMCFLGHNSAPDDDCSSGNFQIVFSYVLVNFVFNALLLLITKHGSALLLVMTGALVIPVTNVLFTVKAVMGDDAEEFSLWDVLGLHVVLVGFVVYSVFGDIDLGLKESKPEEGMSLLPSEEEEEEEVVSFFPSSIGHLPVMDIYRLPHNRRHEKQAQIIRHKYIHKLGIVGSSSARDLAEVG